MSGKMIDIWPRLKGSSNLSTFARSVVIAAIVLSGACSNGPNSTYEELGSRVNTRGFGHKYGQPEDLEEPVLAPGDVISVEVANLPELSSKQPVSYDGSIIAPFIGNVKAAGLTSTQVRDKLTVLLSPYIRSPTIQVIPVALDSKNIYLYTTGPYGELIGRKIPIYGDMVLLDLITDLGGFNLPDDDCHVKVIRADPRHPVTWNINVRDMIVNGYSAGNVHLKADDIVWLPPSIWARVAQEVNFALYPVQVLFRSAREGVGTFYFIERGGSRRGNRGGSGSLF